MPQIQTSRDLDILTSGYPNIQISRYLDIQIVRRLDIPIPSAVKHVEVEQDEKEQRVVDKKQIEKGFEFAKEYIDDVEYKSIKQSHENAKPILVTPSQGQVAK